MSDFKKSFDEILKFEGNYSNHPLDKGGKTKFGITEEVARINGYEGDMSVLPIELARAIYKLEYWDKLCLDYVTDDKTATEIFDIAVNMGIKSAGRMIQEALNLLNRDEADWKEITVDGIIGTQTLTILNALPISDYKYLYKILNGLQFKRYYDIVKMNPSQEVFFRGWIMRT